MTKAAKKDGARAAKPGRRAASTSRGDDAAQAKAATSTVPRRRSGEVREDQRHTVQLKLRLRPEIAAWLRDRAAAWGCTMGEVLEAARPALETKGFV